MLIVWAFTEDDRKFLKRCSQKELTAKLWNDGDFNKRWLQSFGSFVTTSALAKQFLSTLKRMNHQDKEESPQVVETLKRSALILKDYPFILRVKNSALRSDAALKSYENLENKLKQNAMNELPLDRANKELRTLLRVLRALNKHLEVVKGIFYNETGISRQSGRQSHF